MGGPRELPSLYQIFPRDGLKGNTTVDIIAVHGIETCSPKTWVAYERDEKPRGRETYWLCDEDMLPSVVPHARIWAFDYNSNYSTNAQKVKLTALGDILLAFIQNSKEEFGTRPLVFIGSCFGGLVVAQALERASRDRNKYRQLLQSTVGVIFLGTPLRGTGAARDARWKILVSGIMGKESSSTLIKDLEENSSSLENLVEDFGKMTIRDGLQIRCFYETRTTQILNAVLPRQISSLMPFTEQILVKKESACLDCHTHIPLDARHAMMNKFRGPQDGSFRLISSCVKELFNHARIIEFRTAEERECLQMLASDYREYKDRNAMRVPGTCEWFLGHGKFLSWRKENTASLLWVSADPGCGKSVLSKALVDERLLSADSAMPSICYFFFKDDSDDLQSSSDALCALLHQLFIQKPALLKHVMPDFGNYGLRLRAEFGALWDILKKAAADPEAGEIVCVLDALDECKELEKGRLIERLCGFYSTQIKTNTRLKFLITSRPYFDIETAFGEKIEDLTSIRLEGERESKKISEEIDLVIDNVIPRISRARKYPLKLEVQNALVEHLKSIPHRTYLWLHLILDVVRRTPDSTKARLERLVNKIPDSVDKAYEGILKRIDDSEQARRLLHIIVAAERPLTLREMNLALAIDEKLGSRDVCRSYNDLDLEPEEPFETKVRDLCGLFVSVIDSKIYLIHQTAKEFLIYKGIVKVPNSADNRPIIWKHSLEPVESNLVLTSICISYLLFTEFESDPLVIDDRAEYGKVSKIVDRYTNKHGFLDYSATYWANHFREAKVKEMAILESALKVCNTRSKRFLTWFQVYWITIEYYRCPQNFASLMVASYFGQEAVVQQLLEKWADLDVNCKDEDSRTALSWAARNGHETVVQQLLEKRADLDVNYKDEHSRTALSWAAENGHEAVVRQLLEKRADLDVNYKDEYGRTALSRAAENGHGAIVKLLTSTSHS